MIVDIVQTTSGAVSTKWVNLGIVESRQKSTKLIHHTTPHPCHQHSQQQRGRRRQVYGHPTKHRSPFRAQALRAIPKLCKSSVPAIFSLSLPWGWGTTGWGGAPLGKGDWGFRKNPIFLLWVRFLQLLLHFAKKLLPRFSQITICHTFVLFPWLRISVDS